MLIIGGIEMNPGPIEYGPYAELERLETNPCASD